MILDIAKSAEVPAAQAEAWALISDVPRLSGCIPGVADVREIDSGRTYAATVSDKLGPFKLQLPVNIGLQSVEEPRRIVAELTGNDSKGQARVKGQLEATLEPLASGTRLNLGVHMEVLGKLVALGAAPMRRRTDEIFSEFVRRVQAELGK